MPKDVGGAEEEKERLGAYPLEIPAQEETLKKLTEEKSVSVKVLASQNTGGLSCILDTEFRPNIDIYYKVGGVCTVSLQVSKDAKDWKPYYTKSLSGADSDIWITKISYRYIKISSPQKSIDLEFEITAK